MTQNDNLTDFKRARMLCCVIHPRTEIIIWLTLKETLSSGKQWSHCVSLWSAEQSWVLLCVCGQPVLGSLPQSVCAESALVSLRICLNMAKTQPDSESHQDKYGQMSADLRCHSLYPVR